MGTHTLVLFRSSLSEDVLSVSNVLNPPTLLPLRFVSSDAFLFERALSWDEDESKFVRCCKRKRRIKHAIFMCISKKKKKKKKNPLYFCYLKKKKKKKKKS